MNSLRDNCDLIAVAILLALLAVVVPSDLNVMPVLAGARLTPASFWDEPAVTRCPAQSPSRPVQTPSSIVIPDGAELI